MAYINVSSNRVGSYSTIGSSISGPYSSVTVVPKFTQTSMYRTGTTTPNYFKRRKAGELLPMNPYTYYQLVTTGNQGYQTTRWNNYTKQNQTSLGQFGWNIGPGRPSFALPSAAEIASLDAKAVTAVLLKIKDQKVNLVQFAAEAAQTAKLIETTAIAIASSLKALRKGEFAPAAAALGVGISKRKVARMRKEWHSYRTQDDKMSSAWLQLQYGWTPLLNDVYGAAELFAQKAVREVIDVVKTKKTLTLDTQTTDSYYEWKNYNSRKSELTISYTIIYSAHSDTTHTLAQVGVTNPALIAWELLPWSFVIDWFIPFGNYISSLDATVGTSFVMGSKTVGRKSSVIRESHQINAVAGDAVSNALVTSSSREISIQRTVLTDFPRVRFPSFKNPISFQHVANAIALLTQLRKK